MRRLSQFKLILTIIAAKCSDYCFGQYTSLQYWSGTYEGTMQIFGKGKLLMEMPVDLEIGQIPNSNRYTWRMTYYEPYGVLVKDYQMIPPTNDSNQLILDELDGVLLECYAFGNSISSCFETEGLTICDLYLKQGNLIHVDLFGGSYPKEQSVEIKNLGIQFRQSADLIKMN